MNFFRKLVSGKRNRFQYKEYDLDITYVTRRVCGMSFPASGFEQMYRNNINDVRIDSLILLEANLYIGSSFPRRETQRSLPHFQSKLQKVRL